MTFGTARRHPALTNSETPFGSTSVWAIRDVFRVRTGSARGASAGDLADGRTSLALARSSSPFGFGARLLDLRNEAAAPRVLRREICE